MDLLLEGVDDPGILKCVFLAGGPGSGPQNGDEENPYDREPSDDELADIEKQYEGKLTEFKDIPRWKVFIDDEKKPLIPKKYHIKEKK